jgi:hypothetical protein
MTDPLQEYIKGCERSVAAKHAGTDYTDSYVAFIDVMGMKELVKRPYGELRQIFNAAEAGKVVYGGIHVPGGHSFIGPDHLRMTIMSDSLVLSIDSRVHQAFPKLVGFSSYLIQKLIEVLDVPVFLRGGMVRGSIFHDGEVVFGPALVAAHDLEKHRAISMRCIVSPDLLEDQAVQDYLHSNGCALVVDQDDGMHFIDFLRPENRERLAAIATQVINSDADDHLKQKYRWLRRHLDRGA